MGLVFAAFGWAYALFEIPTARWANRRGTRRVLIRIVAWWSSFTMVMAAAFNFFSMLVTQFLFGAGEAGAWPSITSTFSRWIPAKERGRVQGIFFAGAHLSAAVAPSIIVALVAYLSWRWIFLLIGSVGFVWVVAWSRWFRDDPSEHPQVNQAERELILRSRRPPADHGASWEYWRRLATHRNTLPLCLMYIGNVCTYFFCITWFPTYLKNQFVDLKPAELGLATGLPFLLSILGDVFGGAATDWLTRRFGLRIGRCGLGVVAYTLAGAAMCCAAMAGTVGGCVAFFSVAVALAMFTLGAAWATCIDIGGSHSGVVSATMNMTGNGASALSAIGVIPLRNLFNTWNAPLYALGVIFVLGAVCWCLIDPRKRVFD